MKKFGYILLILISVNVKSIAQNDCTSLPQEVAYSNITATQALDTIGAYIGKNWFVILDVRTPGEYNSMHLEEGVNLDFNSATFATDLAALDRNKVYVVHCASGARSAQVYNQMQTLEFLRVYNMTGGINSWNGLGYPVTTSVSPLAGTCETDINFENIILGNTDSILITITNAANSLLTITDISDLSGTAFSSDFDAETTLMGGRDSSFYIYYTPDDYLEDNVVFTINTNGGSLNYNLHGTVLDNTAILSQFIENISVFNDSQNQQIVIADKNANTESFYSLFNAGGTLVRSAKVTDSEYLNYADLSQGIYILRLISGKECKTFKLLLTH